MLGFGELVAHEAAWRLGWGGTKVSLSPYRKGTKAQIDWTESWVGAWI